MDLRLERVSEARLYSSADVLREAEPKPALPGPPRRPGAVQPRPAQGKVLLCSGILPGDPHPPGSVPNLGPNLSTPHVLHFDLIGIELPDLVSVGLAGGQVGKTVGLQYVGPRPLDLLPVSVRSWWPVRLDVSKVARGHCTAVCSQSTA